MLSLGKLNLLFINSHKKRFITEFVPLLFNFKNLALKLDNSIVECSCKIEKNTLHPARFNLWLSDANTADKADFLKETLRFFAEIEAVMDIELNYELFRQFYDDRFDFRRVNKVIMGVDLRADVRDSRLKIWFILTNYPEKVAIAKDLHGNQEILSSLILDDELLVGFDFSLDGRTDIKVYPDIQLAELQQADIRDRLATILSPSTIELMSLCAATHISFTKNRQDKILHFRPIDARQFARHLKLNDTATAAYDYCIQVPKCYTMVSIRERELLTDRIDNLNLYYGCF